MHRVIECQDHQADACAADEADVAFSKRQLCTADRERCALRRTQRIVYESQRRESICSFISNTVAIPFLN